MNPYILLAKEATENYFKEKKVISLPSDLPEELLKKRAGVFVTIMKGKELKGCLGTYSPIRVNLAEEIIHNAIAAATEDCRFSPIQKEELPSLSYTVYVLSEPELVRNLKELNPKKFGIIVKAGEKSGLLLPDLAGVDTIEKQMSICCQKGGIDPNQEEITVYRFKTEKYEQEA